MTEPTLSLSVPDSPAFGEALQQAVDDAVASRIFAQDATLWGPDAEHEAGIRLAWTHLATESRPLVAELASLHDELASAGLDHVVLCGMGGSSLAPEVICRAAGVELTVLDSSQPDMVRRALEDRLERTVVVVSSKSGGTVETDSQRRAYEQAFRDAGIDPAERIVVVTDPGSPLEEQSRDAGYRVFLADPHVGGRYSALTAFGLVPSALAGADVAALLDQAEAVTGLVAGDSTDNPALQLGVALGVANHDQVDKLVLADTTGSGLGDWIEQLVAESTGKIGRGILPVVVESPEAPNADPSTRDSVVVTIGSDSAPSDTSGYAAGLVGDLGAQFLLWEVAVAVAGRLIGINPFDQPDVESAKQAARDLLGGAGEAEKPAFTETDVSVFGTDATTVEDAVADLLAALDDEHGYVAIQAYLDRTGLPELAEVRAPLAERLARPVTFGWGPRFLHSTGQYHKGGPATGVYLQVTAEPRQDLAVPGRDFSFGDFIASQASGDAQVLRDKGRPVVRLHFADAQAAVARLRELLA